MDVHLFEGKKLTSFLYIKIIAFVKVRKNNNFVFIIIFVHWREKKLLSLKSLFQNQIIIYMLSFQSFKNTEYLLNTLDPFVLLLFCACWHSEIRNYIRQCYGTYPVWPAHLDAFLFLLLNDWTRKEIFHLYFIIVFSKIRRPYPDLTKKNC